MFDDDDGVACIAQLLKQANEPFGVARMQPDARFIQNEKGVHQPGAKAGSDVHPFGFAAGERPCRSVQCKVAQADIVEVSQTRMHFVQDQLERIVPERPAAVGHYLNQRQGVADWELVEIRQRQSHTATEFSRFQMGL